MNAITYRCRRNRPPRMARLARLPVFFALADKRAVVAGGSAAAAWKAELLSAAGAQVDVYAADPVRGTGRACSAIRRAARSAIVRRNWTADDCASDARGRRFRR